MITLYLAYYDDDEEKYFEKYLEEKLSYFLNKLKDCFFVLIRLLFFSLKKINSSIWSF